MSLIEPRQPAPVIKLKDQSGRTRTLQEFKGSPVVLFFYPQDDTPTCTGEACGFRDQNAELTKRGAVVVGISPDSAASHAKFSTKYKLPYILLADEPDTKGVPSVAVAFGVWQEKNMYGRTYMGISRTTYLIGPDGRVARRWDKVRIKGHVQSVIDELALLGQNPHQTIRSTKKKKTKLAKLASRLVAPTQAKPRKTTKKRSTKG